MGRLRESQAQILHPEAFSREATSSPQRGQGWVRIGRPCSSGQWGATMEQGVPDEALLRLARDGLRQQRHLACARGLPSLLLFFTHIRSM